MKHMKQTKLMAALIALSAMSAGAAEFAAQEYADPTAGFVSSKTHTEIRSDLEAAVAKGTAGYQQIDGKDSAAGYRNVLSRKDVLDALVQHSLTHPTNAPAVPGDVYFGE